MSGFRNPYDPNIDLSGCSCGRHANQHEHDAAANPVARSTDPKGDRVKVMLSGKYLPYKTY